jgi:DNA polymerase-1
MSDPRRFGFTQCWCVDFEFANTPGSRPTPHTLVAHEIYSGRTLRLFEDEFTSLKAPPYGIGRDALFVAYYGSAEMGCHSALGWPYPVHVLDLFPEFRNLTNGLPTFSGRNLLGALAYFGLGGIDAVEKQSMQGLAARGAPFAPEERAALLDYCQEDVMALVRLLAVMLPRIDLPHAINRGRYMKACARIEDAGIPIDTELLAAFQASWEQIKSGLIANVDRDFGVYEGQTFKTAKFEKYLAQNGIPWVYLKSGALALDDDTFEDMVDIYRQLGPLRQLRKTLSQLKLSQLAVGPDGRNRCILSAFGAVTGRNTPSNAKFVFGLPAWIRGLVKPTEGHALIYADWSAQEFGIAAALSKDPIMIEAYESGDPYLFWAKRLGVVPQDATKATHGEVRDRYKTAAGLGIGYGMQADNLALRIGQTKFHAQELLRQHHETFPRFWTWSDGACDRALTCNELRTVFDWTMHYGPDTKINPRSIRNWPMQAHGAEMLRLACVLATERGLRIIAPVHDALVAEARLEDLESTVEALQAAMVEASRIVLGSFALRSEVKTFSYPDRFKDDRFKDGCGKGKDMWNLVLSLIAKPPIAPTDAAPIEMLPTAAVSELQGVSL